MGIDGARAEASKRFDFFNWFHQLRQDSSAVIAGEDGANLEN